MRSRRQVDERAERVEGALIDAMAATRDVLQEMKRRHEQRDRSLDVRWSASLGRAFVLRGGHELLFVRRGLEIHVSEDGVADDRRVRFDDDVGRCRWFVGDAPVGEVAEVASSIVRAWEAAHLAAEGA